MSSLARAAVAGDERALDLFSSWRPKTGRRGVHQVLYCTVLYCTVNCTVLYYASLYCILHQDQARENLNFFLGSMSGVIYYLNENGSCMEVPRL